MKACAKNRFLLPALIVGLGLMLARGVTAQTFKILYDFPTYGGGQQPDGMKLYGDTLFGTVFWGGAHDCGLVFSVKTDGTGFTNLHSFDSQILNNFPMPFFGTG